MDVIRTVNGEVFATDGMVHNVEPLSGELGHGKESTASNALSMEINLRLLMAIPSGRANYQ